MPGLLDIALFEIFPYVSVALFIVGLIYRGIVNPFAWTTRSSQFLERPGLGAAILTFHWGVILLFVAHLFGLVAGLFLVPSLVKVFYWLGLLGGALTLYGSTLALLRRLIVPEVRATSRAEDYIILVNLFAIAGVALYLALVSHIFGLSLNVAPWIASVFTLQPDIKQMAGLPLLNKIHISLFLILLAYWPYTKLVHVWAFPWRFLTRPPISMRTYALTTLAPQIAAPLPGSGRQPSDKLKADQISPLPQAPILRQERNGGTYEYRT